MMEGASGMSSSASSSSLNDDSITVVREGLNSFPKWKLAVIVGTPLALACALYYRYLTKSNDGKYFSNSSKSEAVDPKQSVPVSNVKSLAAAVSSKEAGNLFLKRDKTAEAIAAYTRAIIECPDDDDQCAKVELAKMYQNRAFAYEKVGEVAATISDCDRAIGLDPSYARAWARRSKAHEKAGNYVASLDDVTTLCILEEFKKEESLEAADRILKALGRKEAAEKFSTREIVCPSPQFVRTYFAAFARDPIFPAATGAVSTTRFDVEIESPFLRARRSVIEGRGLEDVVELCLREISQREDSSSSRFLREALLLKATFLSLQGRGDEAMADLNLLLSSLSTATNDDDRRSNDLLNSSDVVDLRVNALVKRGSLWMQRLEETKAMEDFRLAETTDPLNSDVYHHRGQLNLLLEKTREACQDFTKCVELAPDFAVARVQCCFTQYRHRQSLSSSSSSKVGEDSSFPSDTEKKTLVEETTKMFDDLLEKFPDCAEGWALYGQVMLDEGFFGKADSLFQRALEVEPDNGNVYVHRGLCHLQWNFHDKKYSVSVDESYRQFFEKALEVDSKCEFAYETLGTVEVQNGRLEAASAHFRQAIALAKTEMEMAHLISLNAAAVAQINASQRLGIQL